MDSQHHFRAVVHRFRSTCRVFWRCAVGQCSLHICSTASDTAAASFGVQTRDRNSDWFQHCAGYFECQDSVHWQSQKFDRHGRSLPCGKQVGVSVGISIALGDFPAAGRIHVDVLEVRRNASDRSGNEIVSLPPGQQVNVILNTLCASEDDGFQPFPNPSIGRRAFLMAEQFATSPEKIFTNQPQSTPSIIFINCYSYGDFNGVLIPCLWCDFTYIHNWYLGP